MNAADNIAAWRAQWPEGSERVDDIVGAAVRAGYSRVVAWGSVALGDYVHGQSDVDLLLVCPGDAIPAPEFLVREITASAEGSTGRRWKMDVLGITERALASASPVCLRTLKCDVPYELHGMDLVQLRDYSAPLAGAPIQDLVESRDIIAESRSALQHVLGTMVPQHTQASPTRDASELLLELRRGIEFVLIRCLYSLTHGAVASKTGAAQWAVEQYRSDPTHAVVGQVGARLLAYRRDGGSEVSGAGELPEFTELSASIEEIAGSMAAQA